MAKDLKSKALAGKIGKPKLIIDSLHDAMAHSSDNKWRYAATGPRTKQEIRKEFRKSYK